MQKSGFSLTHCPYCQDQQMQSNYAWREVLLSENVFGSTKQLKAIEIYCSKCHRTLSITPIWS